MVHPGPSVSIPLRHGPGMNLTQSGVYRPFFTTRRLLHFSRWRNTIGLGLFQIGTNALDLWYLWLSEREKKSRRILDRNFEGVDLRNLDLIPNWDGSAVGRADS